MVNLLTISCLFKHPVVTEHYQSFVGDCRWKVGGLIPAPRHMSRHSTHKLLHWWLLHRFVNLYRSWWAGSTLYGNLSHRYECVCEWMNDGLCCKAFFFWVGDKTGKVLNAVHLFAIQNINYSSFKKLGPGCYISSCYLFLTGFSEEVAQGESFCF